MKTKENDDYIDTNDHCVWCKYWRNTYCITTPKSKGSCSRYPQEVLVGALYLCGEFVSKSVDDRDRHQWSHSFEIQAKKINKSDLLYENKALILERNQIALRQCCL